MVNNKTIDTLEQLMPFGIGQWNKVSSCRSINEVEIADEVVTHIRSYAVLYAVAALLSTLSAVALSLHSVCMRVAYRARRV